MKLNTKDYEARMVKAVANYQENLSTIRAGQANSAILNKVNFEYWGAPTPITSMADIRVADAKTLTVTPYDATTLKAMEKAILASDVGITPTNDGKMIRLVFPMLTEERRKDLVKQVKIYGDETKVVIRNNRRDSIDKMRAANKKKELTDDLLKEFEEKVQKITDKYIKNVDDACAKKEKELMEI